ncbi:hypothetical protein ACJ73_10142, partial [Blastomyces percursus]
MSHSRRPKPISIERAQDTNASVPSPRRSARLRGIPPTPTITYPPASPLGDIVRKRSKESQLPDGGKPASKLSKTEVVIATARADPEPDAVRNEDEKPHSRLEIVSKPPAPTVSDASDAEEPDRSRQIKVPRSVVASSSKGKEKEKITPAEQAVEVVLHASPTNPYEILGVPDPSEMEDIQKAYKHLALLLHPDKNKHQRAEEAFKRLNWAGEALRVPDAGFTANAFGDGDESDGDGDIPMPDYEAKPIPDAYIEKLYARATPFVKRLFENPLDSKAENELKQINELITQDVKQHGVRATMKVSMFIIQYPLFASQALMAQLMLRGIESTPIEHFQAKYEDSKEEIDKINAIIATVVEENHYPTCWKVKFSLSEDGKQLLRSYSGEDESRPVAMAAEASNLPRTTAMWKPGETRQGEPILACKQLFRTRKEGRKLRIPEVMGHLFIVQANEPASRICEIRSGSEIGWRATRAYLALPDKKMVGLKNMSYDYEGIEDILKVAYSEDKPGLGLLVCVKARGSEGETDWITRTALRDIWGKGDADAAISEIFEIEGEIAPGRVARVEYKPRRALGSKPRRQRYVESSDEMTDDESDSDVE